MIAGVSSPIETPDSMLRSTKWYHCAPAYAVAQLTPAGNSRPRRAMPSMRVHK